MVFMQAIDVTYISQEKSLDNDNYLVVILRLFLKTNLILVFLIIQIIHLKVKILFYTL